jgi:hypothetical protein
MSNNVTRKTPEELVSKTQKQPLSTRVKVETYEALEHIAKEVGTSLSDLSAGILDDYVQWYEEEGKKKKRK